MKKDTKKRSLLVLLCVFICTLAIGIISCGQKGSSESTYESTSESQSQSQTESDSGTPEQPQENMLKIVAPTEEVYPYIDEVKAYLQAGYGVSVADYHKNVPNQVAPVEVKWRYDAEGAKKFRLEYATKEDFSDAFSIEVGAAKRSAKIYNLYKATTYYLKVSAINAKGETLHTALGTLETTNLGPRFMYIDDVRNVRDLGGYVTADGKILAQGIAYRGGSPTVPPASAQHYPQSISEDGKKYMGEVMGIKTEIDFRTPTEAGLGNDSVIPGATLTYLTLNGYKDALTNYNDKFRELFSILANKNSYPVFMHCTGGADRTGTVIFLLHALLGVSEEECIQGYELTSFSIYNLRSTQTGSYKDNFQAFLTGLKAYTGNTLQEKTENWALSIGVTKQQIDNIKGIFYGDIEVGGHFANAITPAPASRITTNTPSVDTLSARSTTYDQVNIGKLKIVKYNGETGGLTFMSVDSTITYPVSNWDDPFSYVSGNGITLNGNMINMHNSVKSPSGNTLYVGLGKPASQGDVVKIGGVLRCENQHVEYVIEDCEFIFDGSSWTSKQSGSTYQVINLGKVRLTFYSDPGSKNHNPSQARLYLRAEDGTLLGEYQNLYFTHESGTGILVNGEPVAKLNQFKHGPGGTNKEGENFFRLYLDNVSALNNGTGVAANDVITIGGTFVNNDVMVKYIIEDCVFTWSGESWSAYTEYTTHEIGALKFDKVTNTNNTPPIPNGYVYLSRADGVKIPIYSTENNLHWETTFNWKNGVGITINGEPAKATVKFPSQMFVAFTKAPEIGDILRIGGTFYNESIATQYIITESAFEWDGSSWLPLREYDEYEISSLTPTANATLKNSISLTSAIGELFEVDDLTKLLTFYGGSGIGVTLNCELLSVKTLKSCKDYLVIDLGVSVNEGDVLKLGGTFYNVTIGTRYLIEECSFIYIDGAWEVYESDYDEYGLGYLTPFEDASSEKFIYFFSAYESLIFPIDSWEEDDAFTSIFGAGVKLNGETLESAKVRSIDSTLYVSLGLTAHKGYVLTIGGKFVCQKQGVLFYVKECTFVWNGTIWQNVEDVNLSDLKTAVKVELENYKDPEDYQSAEQTALANAIASAKAEIDASQTILELGKVLQSAYESIDELKTAEDYNEESSSEQSSESTESKDSESNSIAKKRGCSSTVELPVLAMLALAGALVIRKKKND